ncbi:hypothetical protein EVJ58_g839 [Rhodofomes roseus]|uniref:tRNA-splicing endonuclease subunit Sen54 N-terminal domain-containing protein n=1 Tax=Rhodofomes roseus TaxID=34475 RepID=A0A4Y9Z5X1_9APHY|nr:hypothetical protein EVJ58_g839 [Rhodofomes roseus]
MDDTLERPNVVSKPVDAVDGDDEQSSGDEDQGPDWTKLPSAPTARPFIPKRGEKDFEPNASGGSGLQRHVLDRSRHAMLEALSAPRTISSKSISYAVWHPDLARAHVTLSRGIHFASMGHSVARTASLDSAKKIHKRLELLPEETLYLVERGAMLCWKACELAPSDTPGLEDVEGIPMTVQQAFAEMIGTADLTLEKYQSLRFLPGGHNAPLHVQARPRAPVSPYQIFYNVYKPSTPFKKTAPPPPEYSVVVVNARTTPMPTLTELTSLFGVLPELPPPLPRKRQSFVQQKAGTAPPPAPAPKTQLPPSRMQRFFPWAFPSTSPPELPRNINPFLSLKTGKKMVVVAAVDAGMTSFFRFGEGVFTEWPMVL